ncbi:MAG: Flp family type IVb pilin [Myxococcota bacterium]|jgi:Flp pilus assembly pilin Flp|nr:Flp family type IVb pilin [Myxococcota bacterium]
MKIDLKSKLEKKSLVKDEEGLSTVEYIIILILIAVIAIVAWQAFGSAVKSKVEGSTDNITNLGG